MESCLLPVMNVAFLFAVLAMSTSEEKAPKIALSAKPDTSVSKVYTHIYIYIYYILQTYYVYKNIKRRKSMSALILSHS